MDNGIAFFVEKLRKLKQIYLNTLKPLMSSLRVTLVKYATNLVGQEML